jgi:predicted deacetylase
MHSKQLLVSIHDVSPHHAERLKRIESFLAECGLGARYTMLVVPDFWQKAPLAEHPDFCAWLKGRAADGVEMLLHGFTHRDETAHPGALARWKAGAMTAREGEFLGLSREDARRRLIAGRQIVERAIRRPVTGFVAPAWLYGPGAHAALRELAFSVAEDQLHVWSPHQGRTLSRSPVVSYASRTPGRVKSSLAWSRLATRILKPCRTVRLALHPHDFDMPALVEEARRAILSFKGDRRLTSYDELASA